MTSSMMHSKDLLLPPLEILLCFWFLLICPMPTRSEGQILPRHHLTTTNLSDSISAGRSLTGNQTLTSSGGAFELGYFSLGIPKRYYIGIWYKEVTDDGVVWVANRDRPLLDTTAEFKISDDGDNLVIQTASRRTVVWSTNLSTTAASSSSPSTRSSRIAVLLNDGNLVLRDLTNSSAANSDKYGVVVWDSFGHPTHCFLPGGRLGVNKITKQATQFITSWKNAEDPSPGRYTNEIDPVEGQTILVWEMTQRYWASGRWNGQYFDDLPMMKGNPYFDFKFFSNESLISYTYTLRNSSIGALVRYKLDVNGQLRHMVWKRASKTWFMFWYTPSSVCEVYAQCGAFGICYYNDTKNPCKCVHGFAPTSPREWALDDWSSGCARKDKIQCGGDQYDGNFLTISDVNLPANPVVVLNSTAVEDQCRLDCVNNCSCTAYSYEGSSRSCYLWSGALLNLRQFSNSSGQSISVRQAAGSRNQGGKGDGSKRSRTRVFTVASIASVVLLLAVVVGTCCIVWRRYATKAKAAGRLRAKEDSEATLIGGTTESTEELPLLELQVIVTATDNFTESNKLGQGGFGPVYKGVLGEDQEVAVKRLSRASKQGAAEFMNEVRLIAKLQHRNLVQLVGCCIENEEKMLVYEYMPNKSLDKFLFDASVSHLLGWKKRFEIVIGIARGLQYLHQESRLRVLHRDLKTSNILLDAAMNPKISDFGLARMFGDTTGVDCSHIDTNKVVGTYGYISPECVMEGRYSTKSDVFSFGVIVLEIVSGKKMTTFRNAEFSLNLLGHAWKLWMEDKTIDLLDPILRNSGNLSQVTRCINIGLLCVQEDTMDRPTMSAILAMLLSDSSTMIEPKQPAYSHKSRLSDSDSIENETQMYTGQDPVSLSTVR